MKYNVVDDYLSGCKSKIIAQNLKVRLLQHYFSIVARLTAIK
jgi:hypothetical protein